MPGTWPSAARLIAPIPSAQHGWLVALGLYAFIASYAFGPGVVVFHAGTSAGPDGEILAGAGRALNVCAVGHDFAQARERAYGAVARIDWPQGFHRTDIGWRALAR